MSATLSKFKPSPKIALTALLVGLVSSAPDASARSLGTLAFEPCTLTRSGTAQTVEAQCSTLKVPENRAAPDARQIELAIAWVPAASAQAEPDPVFMLAGGPGQGARDSYPGLDAAFSRIGRQRHLILVDQRGTGGSNPLECVADGKNAFTDPQDQSIAAARAFAERCAAELGQRADLRYYTTTDAVADLDAVRAAIGAPTINLIGISYGTRVAQRYLATFPQRVRSMVLDGVVPSGLILGSEHARNLDAAIKLQFDRCAEVPACRAEFGDPNATLAALRARLSQQPLTVDFRDPLSDQAVSDSLDLSSLATVVRLFAYAPMTAALLPRVLHQAANGEPEFLAAQARLIGDLIGDSIAHGMQLSVICAEDAPELKADPADADSLLGNLLVEFSQAQCAVWPRGERPPDFFSPMVSDKPVLLLSGEFDPVTPPRYGEQALDGFANGRHLVARGVGHNILAVGCVPRLVDRFIADAKANDLDAQCLDVLTYTPPFIGSYGPEP